jgi:GMP synthase (glutamine-hydrolysing)
MSRTITVIQHHPAEGAGRIGTWATARGIALDVRHAQEDGSHLDAPGDALVVLGGPQSAVEPPPWLASQIAWLRDQHGARPMLGLCLGAQSLAAACGGSVRPLGTEELGWTTVSFDRGAGPLSLDVMQWHSDTFELPPGAARLATGAICPVQGFRLGRSVACSSTRNGIGRRLPRCTSRPVPCPSAASMTRRGTRRSRRGSWVSSTGGSTARRESRRCRHPLHVGERSAGRPKVTRSNDPRRRATHRP